jgi:hypothetical protein
MSFTIRRCIKKISEVSADISAVQRDIEIASKAFYEQEDLLQKKETEAKKVLIKNANKNLD